MKLLIVDDEELTRTGVISSIDWQSIGIQEVLQADDGINGIEMARVHRPGHCTMRCAYAPSGWNRNAGTAGRNSS